MSKKNGIIIGLLVAIVAAALIIFFVTQKDANAPNTDQTANQTPTAQTETESTDQAESQTDVLSGTVAMDISNFSYTKPDITVKKGTTVAWTNQDDMQHDVSHDEEKTGAPQGELLSKGESYSFTFDTVGEFGYHCTPHPYMKGKVTVVE